jgi:hypothetical protein
MMLFVLELALIGVLYVPLVGQFDKSDGHGKNKHFL